MLKKSHFQTETSLSAADAVSSGISLESDALDKFLSLEDKSDEIEYAIYGELVDPDVLSTASEVILQEQWEYRTHGKDGKPTGTLRSRKINEGERYELTVKSYKAGDVGVVEVNQVVDEDMFEAISNLADRGLRKVRYIFPVQVEHDGVTHNLKWEVDQFILPNGDAEKIVKVDFEVPNSSMGLPTMPFEIKDEIVTGVGKRPSEAQFSVIDGMFKRATFSA